MSETVIKIENLGKKYTIGHQTEKERYIALRDVIMQGMGNFWRKTREFAAGKPVIQGDTKEEIWALKNVNFEIKQGDTVGIIGRNGAGKSTLLKILSRITEPTTGRITLKGRVASLLEVGTGFHPELTGRENIYLNGAILGMSRSEIKKKFDEIVAFAEIERFLDTPVKRYSSGMYVRLAFAVAAHLEPEILLVDEVLAVGDAAFQKKCLGKMGEVSKAGRTVLFVSHNMAAIQRLCSRSLLIDLGQIKENGNTSEVIECYLNSFKNDQLAMDLGQLPRDRNLGEIARITHCNVYDSKNIPTNTLAFGEPFIVELSCKVLKPMEDTSFLVGIDSIYEQRIATITSVEAKKIFSARPGESITGHLTVRNFFLKPGIYTLTLGLFGTNIGIDRVPNCVRIEVSDISFSQEHIHIDQITIGYLQLPDPIWQIEYQ